MSWRCSFLQSLNEFSDNHLVALSTDVRFITTSSIHKIRVFPIKLNALCHLTRFIDSRDYFNSKKKKSARCEWKPTARAKPQTA